MRILLVSIMGMAPDPEDHTRAGGYPLYRTILHIPELKLGWAMRRTAEVLRELRYTVFEESGIPENGIPPLELRC